VRADIGLKSGKGPFLEMLVGLGNYVMMLPLVAIGLVLFFLLLHFVLSLQGGFAGVDPADNFSLQPMPTHPIIHEIVQGGWWAKVQIFLLASFFAPIVEEIMFRGVLYRHLREFSCRLGFFLSFAF